MPFPSTIETLNFLADAIDANEDEVETARTPDCRKHLTGQLEWLRARFSTEYSQFLAATGRQVETQAAQKTKRI